MEENSISVVERKKIIEEVLGSTFSNMRPLWANSLQNVLDDLHKLLSNIPEDKKKDKNFTSLIIDDLSDYISDELRNLDYEDEDNQELEKKCDTLVDEALKHIITEDLSRDEDFLLDCIASTTYYGSNLPAHILQHTNPDLTNTKKFMMQVVKIDGFLINNAIEQLKNDKDMILAAIESTHNEIFLKNVNQELRNNKDFMLKAVSLSSGALEYASNKLRNDKNFILDAIMQNPNIPDYCIGEILQKDSLFMYKVSSTRQQARDSERQDDNHKISEIESTISDRKTENINNVISNISEKMQDNQNTIVQQ